MKRIGSMLAVGAAVVAAPALAAGAAPRTELTSDVAGGQVHGNASTYWGSLSGNGRRALFTVDDDDLPGEDGTRDVYVRDREKDTTRLVSKAGSGGPASDGSSDDPAISPNGRFVTFASNSDVLPGAAGTGDLYIRDLSKGKTTLVSRTPSGAPAGGGLGSAQAVSFNGRFVVFESSAASLGADPSGSVFVRDRQRGKTKLASATGDGDVAIGSTAAISANGRFVAFESEDDDLPGLDGTTDVFRRELSTGKTVLVSRSNQNAAGEDDSFYASISGGGGTVAFTSRADNLSGKDDDSYSNTFVRVHIR